MKKTGMILGLAAAGFIVVTSCNNPQESKNAESTAPESTETALGSSAAQDIPYTVAERYFVNNTVKGKIENPKIETKEEFDRLFGMATAMGENGMPTEIDFDKQYVIAVNVPETDIETTLEPVSLQKSESGDVVFTYRKTTGDKQSHTSIPLLMVVVDKSATGNVVVQEVNN